MTDLRVLLVSRRFWPLVGDAEDGMADLAGVLARHGARTSVLTAQWAEDWPSHSWFDTTPVVRLPLHGLRRWNLTIYRATLRRWLRRHRPEFDVVLVAQLSHEAYAAVRALRGTSVPVVVRAEAECGMWQEPTSLLGRVRRPAALLVRDEASRQVLLRAGHASALVHTVPDGVRPRAFANGASRFNARMALAAVNHDLTAAIDAPVVVCSGPLRSDPGLVDLVQGWKAVAHRWPTAKLWLLGDGPYREELYQLIGDLDLRHCVLMPGTFEDVDEVLHAANLLVCPQQQESLPRILLAAAATGLPSVARTRSAFESHPELVDSVRLIAGGDSAQWSRSILESLDQPPDRDKRKVCRQEVLKINSLARMAHEHLALFHRLLDQTPCV